MKLKDCEKVSVGSAFFPKKACRSGKDILTLSGGFHSKVSFASHLARLQTFFGLNILDDRIATFFDW